MLQFLVAFSLAAVTALVVATLLASAIGRAGFPLPPDDRRLGCVDGLRGYLALSVLVHHFFIWSQSTRLGGSWAPPSIHFLNQLGAGSVGLFFMTTGLVFYPRILRGFAATSWPSVLISRLFRIVPLIVVSVVATTLVIMIRTGMMPDGGYPLAAAKWISTWSEPPLLGYTDSGRLNAYVLWSLWYEWLFYLLVLPICAGVMDLVRSHQLPSWVVPVLLLGVGVAARLVAKLLGYSIDRFFFYLPFFAAGMLAFEFQSRPTVRSALSRPRIAAAAGAALLIGMATTSAPNTLTMPLFAFFFTCVSCGNDLGGLLRGRGALVLGECSFGIYLLHGLLLDMVFVDAGASHDLVRLMVLPVLLPVAAGAIVLVTSVTYLLIERPAMRSGRPLAAWLAGRRVGLDSREVEVAP